MVDDRNTEDDPAEPEQVFSDPDADLPDPDEDLSDPDAVIARHLDTPRPSWRKRTASGALLTGMALGLQQVFEPKRDEPSITMETSGEPPEDLPVEAEFDGLAPRRSVVKIRPWLLTTPGASTETGSPDDTGTPDDTATPADATSPEDGQE